MGRNGRKLASYTLDDCATTMNKLQVILHDRYAPLQEREGGRFIRLSDQRGNQFTYCSDIEAFASEVERVTGQKVRWECGPCLYFYRAWIEGQNKKLLL